MNTETLLPILTITLTLLGGGVGYLLKSYFEKKKSLTNEVTKERREIYQQYVNLIISLFENSKLKKSDSSNTMMTELYEFYKKYVLYASPKVIKAFSDYFQLMYRRIDGEDINTKLHLQAMTKIMLEMRNDLGLKNDGLGSNGEMLMRALIKDYDSIWNQ
ncbi:hypothetical protein Q2T40_07735 [Winogradskyella maritima]|uniref:Phage abortive infection protein n=1 Tax=Winogradskyella maritima TaxID=1517766 RepID=A0ABV8AND2_9FLAO|nr:hypothetical protein [Winogradskyella maritima]